MQKLTISQRKSHKRNLKNFETNKNGNASCQDLCNAGKAVLGGKFTGVQAYLQKEEQSKTK